MRSLVMTWLICICLSAVLVSSQDSAIWDTYNSKDVVRPFILDDMGVEEVQKPALSPYPSRYNTIRKRIAAMGVDIPDYILHYRGKSPDLGSFRERLQLSGRR